MDSGGSQEVKNVIISIGTKIPESLQFSKNKSQTKEWTLDSPQKSKMSLSPLGPRIHECLQVPKNKWPTNETALEGP
jgi:hypothetical protein